MPSVVDVVNNALDKLGQSPITSLEDGNKTASLANRKWNIIRKRLLRSHVWNFAVKRTTLAPLSESPSWGFTYQHEMPSDLLRVIEVKDLSAGEYQIENNRLFCDDDVVYLRYVYDVTDPNEYDSLFIDLLSTMLAFDMCEALTQSNTKKQLLADELNQLVSESKFIDAVENPPAIIEEDSWVEARY